MPLVFVWTNDDDFKLYNKVNDVGSWKNNKKVKIKMDEVEENIRNNEISAKKWKQKMVPIFCFHFIGWYNIMKSTQHL